MIEQIRNTDKQKIMLHSIAWILFIIVPVFLLDNFERISRYVPLNYYLSCLLLIPIYYLSNQLVREKKFLRYMLFMALFYAIYYYLPAFVCTLLPESDFTANIYNMKLGKQSKIRLGTIVLFLVVWAGSIISYLYDLREKARLLQEENTEAQLSLLKSQINPHFFFNSLNAIYYLAMQKSDNAPKAIITLSDMMRYVLTDAKVEQVTLGQEKFYLDKYIELQRLRLPEKTKLDYTVSLEDESVEVAPLLFIPFIENAFKYGLSADFEATILIVLKATGRKVEMIVENRVVSNKGEENGTENGLANVRKRLDLIYPGKYDLVIDKNDQNYKVNLSISLS